MDRFHAPHIGNHHVPLTSERVSRIVVLLCPSAHVRFRKQPRHAREQRPAGHVQYDLEFGLTVHSQHSPFRSNPQVAQFKSYTILASDRLAGRRAIARPQHT
jgi:hypothetical protein